jgi:tetratricopeptide (TPR) repeat protein
MKKTAIAATLIILVSALAAPAIAAPGGGGGNLPATAGQRVDPAKAFEEGVAALKAKDYKLAEKKFADVLSVAPKHPEANYYMALAKSGQGEAKKSIRYLERAIKERPNFVEAREKLALVSIELGDPEAAKVQMAAIESIKTECESEGACDEAFKARVDKAIERVSASLATPEPQSSDGSAAAETDPQALFFAPRETGAELYVAAVRLINEGKYVQAIAMLEQSQAIIGPHPDILNYLGYSNRKLGRMESAASYYREALAINPDHLGANEYLGELYLEIGDIAAARWQLAKLDTICKFGCAEREDLARLIDLKSGDRQASR